MGLEHLVDRPCCFCVPGSRSELSSRDYLSCLYNSNVSSFAIVRLNSSEGLQEGHRVFRCPYCVEHYGTSSDARTIVNKNLLRVRYFDPYGMRSV